MTRTYKSVDARTPEKTPITMATAPAPAGVKVDDKKAKPGADRVFQPGDIVSFRSNTRGNVLAVTGDGVQVDFGLGSGWFSKDVLTLIKAAGNN